MIFKSVRISVFSNTWLLLSLSSSTSLPFLLPSPQFTALALNKPFSSSSPSSPLLFPSLSSLSFLSSFPFLPPSLARCLSLPSFARSASCLFPFTPFLFSSLLFLSSCFLAFRLFSFFPSGRVVVCSGEKGKVLPSPRGGEGTKKGREGRGKEGKRPWEDKGGRGQESRPG